MNNNPKLIISLTSYPARIPALHHTLKTLLNQTLKADMVILWLAPEQFPNGESDLPNEILDLKGLGLTIDWYHDIRSYKKLIPALKKYPNDIIVTADDDILYPDNWLELMYEGYKKHPYSVQCHRAFDIKVKDNEILPYKTWGRGEIIPNLGAYGVKSSQTAVGFKNFFTGGAGALYPPQCLHPDALNEELFTKISPTEDDVWFWAMAIRNNTTINVVDGNLGLFTKNEESSQEFALYNINSQNNTTHNIIWRIFEQFPDVYENIVRKSRLIVSLTSFPARINTVHQTIESLINQTKKADKIILWLAPEQFPNGEKDLPENLLQLKECGLTIDWYHDIRSYKKLIPTLRKYPNELIVTVDDDIIYKPTMLEKLYDTHIKHPKDVVCHRATKFVYERDKFKTIAGGKKHYRGAHFLNKLTGCGGVLYPPKCFYKDILNEDLILKLAPTNDDQWFWLMAALSGVGVRVVKDKEIELNYTDGSQEFALCLINDQGEKLFWKDFNRLMEYYPQLKKLLKKEGIKTHWFYKERDGNRRRFYLFGKRILSYKKPQKKLADLNKKELIKLLGEQFYKKTGKKPTDELTTLAEKVIWASMFDVTDLKVQCTDKIAVRDYVAKTVGKKYLPELYAVYDNEKQFNLDALPDKFLLTYNAGADSAQTMLVLDKSKLNQTDVQNTLKQWLKFNLAEIGYEMQYLPIKPRVMARELLDIRTDIEYKLWCFGGRVEFICQNTYAHGHSQVGFATYDRKWNKLDFWQKVDNSFPIQDTIQKPYFLDEMITVAEKLAKPFDFVRVDFYETVDGKLMFGELTFSPSAGKLEYAPDNDAIQKKYGALFNLPPRDKNGFAIRKK